MGCGGRQVVHCPGFHQYLLCAGGKIETRNGNIFRPSRPHRIYGLFASTNRAESIAMARALLNVAPPDDTGPQNQPDAPRVLPYPCPRCGARMIVIEVFARGCQPSWRPTPGRIDTS